MPDIEHTQTEHPPKPLADIVREETGDGRLLVRFLTCIKWTILPIVVASCTESCRSI